METGNEKIEYLADRTINYNILLADYVGERIGPTLWRIDGFVYTEPGIRQFAEGFDWLMLVVEKIVSTAEDNSTPYKVYNYYIRTFGKISESGHKLVRFNTFGLHEAPTLLEATYMACVEAVIALTGNDAEKSHLKPINEK